MRKTQLAVFLVFFPAILLAATIHVPAEQPTIQAGIDAAIVGDTVLVAPGEYTEGCYEIDSWWTVSLIVKSGIYLLSEGGPDVTTIRSAGCDRILYCVGLSEEVVIEGFTIRDVTCAFHGTALYCTNSLLVVRDCLFTACSAFGPPLYFEGSEVYFDECIVYGLGADGGYTENGALGIEDTSFYSTDCVFMNNVSYNIGGAITVRESWAEFERCLFSENEIHTVEGVGGNGGAIASHNSFLTISGCTFDANSSARRGSGVYSKSDMYLGVLNTIVTNGYGGAAIDVEGDPVGWWINCTDCYGNEGGDWEGFFEPLLGVLGNISQDPMFCEPEASNFHLNAFSPCAAENNPECGQIGSFGIACGETSHQNSTWSDVKILY